MFYFDKKRFVKSLILALVVSFIGITKVEAAGGTELLKRGWYLRGYNGASEKYENLPPSILKGKTALKITYNLNGTCLLGGDASAIIFDQPDWHYISLSDYGENCKKGRQTVTIPLSDFPQLDTNKPVGSFHVRIWNEKSLKVDITSAILLSDFDNEIIPVSTPVPTLAPTLIPTPTPSATPTLVPTPTPTITPDPTATPTVTITPTATPSPTPTATPIPTPEATPIPNSQLSWEIRSVSSMKETKDKICNQDDQAFINKWVDKAIELGVNYVAVETPYDNPSCGNALSYTKAWVDTIHSKGLNVWHRHMFLAFEGIYDTPKSQANYLDKIAAYIKDNPALFKEGDIFTPIPEPQNGGIQDFTYCPQNVCMFDSIAGFNKWLLDAIDVSSEAFSKIGLDEKIKIGYYGFDGFITWGSNNPDWDGILEDATVEKMGNLTIDHYPELIGQTMEQGLDELQAKYPNVPIIIGEWGSAGSGSTEEQVINSMGAAKRPGVIGFNYWHMGMGGNEALINSDFSNNAQFDEVQSFFTDAR